MAHTGAAAGSARAAQDVGFDSLTGEFTGRSPDDRDDALSRALADAFREGEDPREGLQQAIADETLSKGEQVGLALMNFIGGRLTGGTQRPALQDGEFGLAQDFSLGPMLASLAPGVGGAAQTVGTSPLVSAVAQLVAKAAGKRAPSLATGGFISRAEIDADLAARRAGRLAGDIPETGDDEPTAPERAAASVTPVPEPDLDSLSLALAILQNRGRTF